MKSQESILQRWKSALKKPRFRLHCVAILFQLLFLLIFIPRFFHFVQQRNGFVLNDPLLNLIWPENFSWITFTLIYCSLLAGFIHLAFMPEKFVAMLQAYCILNYFRILTLLVVPLNEPSGIIVLNDPFTVVIGYGGTVITKDLFFSGHVSTVFLLFLFVHNKILKGILLVTTIIIASLILVQHVHYTIDVVAAPFFSWLAMKSSLYLQRRIIRS